MWTKHVLLEASFLEGGVAANLRSDEKGDKNVTPLILLKEILAKVQNTKATAMEPLHVYIRIAIDRSIHCSKRVTVDIYRKVRNVSSLHLRNVTWKIP